MYKPEYFKYLHFVVEIQEKHEKCPITITFDKDWYIHVYSARPNRGLKWRAVRYFSYLHVITTIVETTRWPTPI